MLPRQQWFLLNRFRTEQGHWSACRRKWRLTDTDLCPCGETQTMSHIVESCPLTKLNGGLSQLHSADDDAVSWLTSYGSWHAYEKKKNALPLPIVRCWSPLASPFSEEQALVSFGLALCMFVVFIDCCFRFLFCHLVVIVFVLLNPLTSSWPHLRCDVGLEEGEYK